MAPRQSPINRAVDARERGFRRVSAVTAALTFVSVVGTGIVAAAARAATVASRSASTAGSTDSTGSTGSAGSTAGTDDGGTSQQPNDDLGGQGNFAPAPAQAPPQATSSGS